MIKSIEQLLNVANDIKLVLKTNDFRLFHDGEISFMDVTITQQISKDVLKIIPNDFIFFPNKNGKCILRIFGMTADTFCTPSHATGKDCDNN